MNPVNMLSAIDIDSFLRLGYFIGFQHRPFPISFDRIDKTRYLDATRQELVRTGITALRESFERDYSHGDLGVVPLSGGLDSRMVLCALLELTDAKRIETFTYGIPGSYDFEIGCLVAQHAGTRHTPIPLDKVSWDEDELVETAKRERCQAVLFYNQPLHLIEKLYGGALFWSGFVGDAVAGSHLHDPPSKTLKEAKRTHLKERTFVRSTRLHRCSDDQYFDHLGGGRLDPEELTWDEQVLFEEAIPKFTVAHILWEGFRYRTPFINSAWMDFMFSVPNDYRLGQQLMIDIGRAAFPGLFDLPSTNGLGHGFDTPDAVVKATFWLNRARKLAHQFLPWVNYPLIQYNDFNEGIRSDPSLRRVVRGSIEDLRKRGTCDWVDFDGIWRRHDRRIRNHGDALIVLASLELIFKARESTASA